jgi:hypothetical protein
MAGIQDFIGQATQKLGISKDAASAGAGGLLSMIQQNVGAADFGKLAAAIPGADALAKSGGGGGGPGGGSGGGLGGMLGGLAQKAGGLLGGNAGGAAGALGALAGAGLTGEKASGFLGMFMGFLKQHLKGDLLKNIASKVPGLGGLLG